MLILVGDAAQSVYGFRGADPSIFGSAPDVVPDCARVTLPNNYRSHPDIVALGNRVMADMGLGASGSVEAIACARSRYQEPAIDVLVGEDPLATAYSAVDDLLAHRARDPHRRLGDYAFIVRTNNAAALYEGALMARGVPAARWGGTPFWERPDVLAFVGYGLLACGPRSESEPGLVDDVILAQSGGAFRRIVNRPKRFLARAWVDRVVTRVERGEPLTAAIRAEKAGLGPKPRKAALEMATLIDKLRRHSWPHVVTLIRETLTAAVPKDQPEGQPDEERRAIPATCAGIALREHANGQPLQNGLQFAMYADYAAKNAQAAKDELPEDKVVLATIHKMKGLERPYCYVPIDPGLLPHERAGATAEGLREEQRLAYVAFTRAKHRLVVTTAALTLERRVVKMGETDGLPPFGKYLTAPLRERMAEGIRQAVSRDGGI